MVSSVVWLCSHWLEEGRQNEQRLGWRSIKERYREKSTTPERKRNQQSTFFKHIWNGTKGRCHARAIIFPFYCLVQLGVRISDKTTWNSVTCVYVCNFRVHCRTTGIPEGYSMLQKSRESFPITNLSTGSFFKAFLCQRGHPGETGQDLSREEVRGCRSNAIYPLLPCPWLQRLSTMFQNIIRFIWGVKFSTHLPCCVERLQSKKKRFFGVKRTGQSHYWEFNL